MSGLEGWRRERRVGSGKKSCPVFSEKVVLFYLDMFGILEASEQESPPLKNATGQQNDRERMLERVARNGWALQDATVKLRGDRDVVMTAVAQEGWALQYATDELRGDREVVMTAVGQDGWALQFATEELRGDREVVMTAAGQNGRCSWIRDRGAQRRP